MIKHISCRRIIMQEYEIIFYKTDNGEIPVKEFLDSLNLKMRAKVGSDISRVLYFFVLGRKIVLTNGFVKKT